MRSWRGSISLETRKIKGSTRLSSLKHEGPLRVQRPFFQDDGSCHIYLIHPPGGVVGGDSLSVHFEGHEETNTLITSSAASKFYSCEGGLPDQKVSQDFKVQKGSLLEWVPQENIFFDGAKTSLTNKITLSDESRFFGWDITVLGRKGPDKNFFTGALRSSTTIVKNERLVHRDFFEYSPTMDTSSWGLQGKHVLGSLIATSAYIEDDEFSRLVSAIKKKIGCDSFGGTKKKGLFLLRYLGSSVEECKRGFYVAREIMHQNEALMLGCDGERPRIWNY
ncbi:MAG: hypothetical protein CMQ40_11740 [Gammaproteobacteria bacterium]|nr:hypothetical protein [Gammaproteobacteria bacterium]